jgi:hypothetical protein
MAAEVQQKPVFSGQSGANLAIVLLITRAGNDNVNTG